MEDMVTEMPSPIVSFPATIAPMPLDMPAISSGTVPQADVLPKRQRAYSELGKLSLCSFDAYDDGDLEQMWEALDPNTSFLEQIPILSCEAIGQGVKRPQDPIANSRRRTSRRAAPKKPATSDIPQSLTKRISRKRTPPANDQPTRRSAFRTVNSKRARTAAPIINTIAEPVSVPEFPGKCTPEERREKVARYLEKRSRRVWRKEIKYSCRKQFAESRPRVAGRFIPKPAQTPPVAPATTPTLDTPKATMTNPAMIKISPMRDVVSPMSTSSMDSPTSDSARTFPFVEHLNIDARN